MSLEETLLMVVTRPTLSHWNNAVHLANWGTHTAQLITIRTGTFAIIPTGSIVVAMTTETNGDPNILCTPGT